VVARSGSQLAPPRWVTIDVQYANQFLTDGFDLNPGSSLAVCGYRGRRKIVIANWRGAGRDHRTSADGRIPALQGNGWAGLLIAMSGR
jgi:hypothetical protein